jgi:8-hydroxy-5-deazaflavin:NADPH oxidoreductase
MTTIGMIGAGQIGSQIARQAVRLGYDVVISNSRGPETLTELVKELGPSARAASTPEAAAAADFAVVAVPLKNYQQVPADQLAGKIVIDTNNYDADRDGYIEAIDHGTATVSGLLQEHLTESKIVKGFNLILAPDITTDGTPKGTPNRRALATASDYPDAIAFITAFYDEFGYDTVSSGDLNTSWRFDRGDDPAYTVAPQTADQLAANLARAKRN